MEPNFGVRIFHCRPGYIGGYVPDSTIKMTNENPVPSCYFNFCLAPKQKN